MSKGVVRWTPEQLAAFEAKKKAIRAAAPQPVKQPKYRNTKCEYNGMKFDSIKELERWKKLELLAAAGYIKDLQRQVAFVLAPAVKIDGEKRKKPALRYIADAVYIDNGQTIVEDTKSEHTRKLRPYRDRKHLMKVVFGISIKEI